jgi:hypothetical protein
LRRPKLTIRAALGIQLVIGIILWLTLSAVLVYRAKETHEHTWVGTDSGRWGMQMDFVEARFWPRFWRRLLGMPWTGGQVPCLPTPGRIEEVCSLTHLEIVIKSHETYQWTPTQAELYRRLWPRRSGGEMTARRGAEK